MIIDENFRFAPFIRWRQTTVSGGTGDSLYAERNPSRVALLLPSLTTASISNFLSGGTNLTSGFQQVATATGGQLLTYEEFGPLVSEEWRIRFSAATQTTNKLEGFVPIEIIHQLEQWVKANFPQWDS
jgi:hypothetical protein